MEDPAIDMSLLSDPARLPSHSSDWFVNLRVCIRSQRESTTALSTRHSRAVTPGIASLWKERDSKGPATAKSLRIDTDVPAIYFRWLSLDSLAGHTIVYTSQTSSCPWDNSDKLLYDELSSPEIRAFAHPLKHPSRNRPNVHPQLASHPLHAYHTSHLDPSTTGRLARALLGTELSRVSTLRVQLRNDP